MRTMVTAIALGVFTAGAAAAAEAGTVVRATPAPVRLTDAQMGRFEVLIHRWRDASGGSFGPESAAPEGQRSASPGAPVGSARPGASAVHPPSPVHGGVAVARPPVKPREAALSSSAKFFVQLAAFRNEANVDPAWQRLRRDYGEVLEGLERTMERAETDRGPFYRLRVGPFETRAAAARICRALVQRRADCFVAPPQA